MGVELELIFYGSGKAAAPSAGEGRNACGMESWQRREVRMAWYTQFFVHSKGPWIQVYQGLGGFLVHSMKGEIRMAYGNSPVKIPKASGKITFRKMTDKT